MAISLLCSGQPKLLFCDWAAPVCVTPTVTPQGPVTICSNNVAGDNVSVTFTVGGADSMSAVMTPSNVACTLSKFLEEGAGL